MRNKDKDMVIRSLLATALASVAATAAVAADLPSRRAPPPSAYVAVPVFTWTGFYFGANAGYIGSDNSSILTSGNNGPVGGPSTIFNVNSGARPGSVKSDPNGFTGGGQIGYNYQIGSIVVGLEADAAYTDRAQSVGIVGSTGAISAFRTDLSYIGTVRGRLGYAFDRFLVYGTGGLAYGGLENNANFFATPAAGGISSLQFSGGRNKIETGYTVGGGIEYAIPTTFSLFNSNAVTLKVEGLYYDLGKNNITVADTGLAPAATRGQSYNSRFETDGFIVRTGINFKFGTF